MTAVAAELLARCRHLGVEVAATGGKLVVEGDPAGVDLVVDDLRRLKGELLRLLAAERPVEAAPLTAADVESFAALGCEVKFSLPGGATFWLVPTYTARDRREITPEDMLKLDQLRQTFPGSRTLWTWSPKGVAQ